MASKYIKLFSTSLIIKEMKIKTTIRLHLTTVRKAITENEQIKNKLCVKWESGETGTLYTIGRKVKWCSHLGKQHGDSSRIKNRTTLGSSNPTLFNLSQRTEDRILKRYLHSCVHCSIIRNSQETNNIKYPLLKGWRKQGIRYSHTIEYH